MYPDRTFSPTLVVGIVVLLVTCGRALEMTRARGFIASEATHCSKLAPNVTGHSGVDYRDNLPTILSPVKDQGSCGDCWAFSATQQVETYFAIVTNKLLVLSVQQLTSCTQGNGGCTGGDPRLAFQYLANLQADGNEGLVQDCVYPFTSIWNGEKTFGPTCQFDFQNMTTDFFPAVVVSGCTDVPIEASGDSLAYALWAYGPMSVSVNASLWKYYWNNTADTIMEPSCSASTSGFDHAVQLVGFGTTHDNVDYWIVRNSWGTGWGYNGYMRFHRSSSSCDGNGATQVFGLASFPKIFGATPSFLH